MLSPNKDTHEKTNMYLFEEFSCRHMQDTHEKTGIYLFEAVLLSPNKDTNEKTNIYLFEEFCCRQIRTHMKKQIFIYLRSFVVAK